MPQDPPVFVGITTLPSRIALLEPTIESLLAQSLPPSRIFVSVPRWSARESTGYEIPGWLTRPPSRVQLVRSERDYGPATKLLGCLPQIREEACLILADDDMVYKPFLVERLYRAQLARRDASFSFFVERIGRLRVGFGADGFSHWTPNLAGVDEFAARALRSPHLFVEDDIWISLFLQNKRVAIETLQGTLGPGEFVWERSHAERQLSDLTGELGRPNIFRQGRRFLLANGLLGPRLRLMCRLTALEGAMCRALALARGGLASGTDPGRPR